MSSWLVFQAQEHLGACRSAEGGRLWGDVLFSLIWEEANRGPEEE